MDAITISSSEQSSGAMTINSSNSSSATDGSYSVDRTRLPGYQLDLMNDSMSKLVEYNYLEGWLEQQNTLHAQGKEQETTPANGLSSPNLPSGVERLLHTPIVATPDQISKRKRPHELPAGVDPNLPQWIDEDTVDDEGYKAFCAELAKQPKSTQPSPDSGFTTPTRPIKLKVPSAPKKKRYSAWSMSRLQEEFLARFAPMSQKHLLDKSFMVMRLTEDDHTNATPKTPTVPSKFSGPPPASYLCFRCMKAGHWIQNCPGTLANTTPKLVAKPRSNSRATKQRN